MMNMDEVVNILETTKTLISNRPLMKSATKSERDGLSKQLDICRNFIDHSKEHIDKTKEVDALINQLDKCNLKLMSIYISLVNFEMINCRDNLRLKELTKWINSGDNKQNITPAILTDIILSTESDKGINIIIDVLSSWENEFLNNVLQKYTENMCNRNFEERIVKKFTILSEIKIFMMNASVEKLIEVLSYVSIEDKIIENTLINEYKCILTVLDQE